MATQRMGQNTLVRVNLTEAADAAHAGSAATLWTVIPQQSECSIDEATDTEDASVKQSGGWTEDAITGGNWSLSCDLVFDRGDPVHSDMIARKRSFAKILVSTHDLDTGVKEGGPAIISKISRKYGNKTKVTATFEFKMQGAPIACAS